MEGYNKILLEFNEKLHQQNQNVIGGAQFGPNLRPPTVITVSAQGSEFGEFSADGNVLSDGGSPLTAKGFVAGINPNLTVIANLAYTSPYVDVNDYGVSGQQTPGGITGLIYIAAFATNAVGTSYGQSISVNVSN